jgi:DNA polymerase III epsilon subunit-like protein
MAIFEITFSKSVFLVFSIIEIGAVEIVDGVRTGFLYQSYAKPTSEIHPMSYEAHQLTAEFLADSPSIETVLKVCKHKIRNLISEFLEMGRKFCFGRS